MPVKSIALSSFALFLFSALLHGIARADSPPDLPLPTCQVSGGQQQGACPDTNQYLSGSASGPFTVGSTVTISTDPDVPVCDQHNGYPPYPWNPSPCYSRVYQPAVLGCGYIDLLDGNKWKESSCPSALFKDPGDAIFPMFNAVPPPGKEGCSGGGAYGTYVYGGPANVPERKWVNRGPNLLNCNLTFAGPRPDGLYGPTWVKMRVGIDKAENGDERRGFSEFAEFYVPIDGDMRSGIDVELLATSQLEQRGDAYYITYTLTLTNKGEEDAENVKLTAAFPGNEKLGDPPGDILGFPSQLHVLKIVTNSIQGTNELCTPDPIPKFAGSSFACDMTIKAQGDPLGNDVQIIDIETRVLNAADLPPYIVFTADVSNDFDESDNEAYLYESVGLSGGSIAQTRQAMQVIAPYFNYATEAFNPKGCNEYRDDIYARFEAIRQQHPQVFANLSYGPVTSGKYPIVPGVLESDGHVGLIVYPKGTNYHETGIIIHGIPCPSPLHWDAVRLDTQIGTFPIGYVGDPRVDQPLQGTWESGLYYRTPVDKFPGYPKPEGDGCGFEGLYVDNGGEFARSPSGACIGQGATSCPIAPDTVAVTTESPVELRVTNALNQRIETQNGRIVRQEVPGNFTSMALAHEDGTFGWTLALPVGDYDIDLIGTATGPYTLKITKFDEQGGPVHRVLQGDTAPGQVDNYQVTVGTTQDVDGDGVEDADDNCPVTPNADQSDVEGDGVGDVCDNCPGMVNENQQDSDNDGLGDVCDPTPGGEPVPGDIDGNGIVDDGDYTALRSSLGRCEGEGGYIPEADFTGDACVAYDDYQFWYESFYGGDIQPPGC